MNELLNELLTSVLTEAPKKITASKNTAATGAKKQPSQAKNTPATQGKKSPAQQAKDSGYKSIGSTGYWSKTGEKPAEATTRGGVFKVLNAKEREAANKELGADVTAASGDQSKDVASKKSSEVQSVLHSMQRLNKTASSQGKQFISALEAGNAKAISKLIKDLEITISKDGKIKAMAVEGLSDVKKMFGDNKNAPLYINKILESMGLPLLPIETIPKGKTVDVSVEEFKPSSVFADTPSVATRVHAGGVEIGQSDFNILTSYPPNTKARRALMVERKKLTEIQNRYPGITPAEVERKVDDINGIIDTHNTRIRFLQAEIERGGNFYDLGSGPDAIKLINERLQGVLQNKLKGKEGKAVQMQLDKLANASSVEEFDAGWKLLNSTLSNSSLPNGSIPLICEHLTAMRSALRGANIMLPTSDTFKLGDIIAYSPEGVNTQDVRSIVDGVQLIEVGLDIKSVKRDSGAGSAVGSRTEASAFAGEGITDVLNVLGRSPVKGQDPGTIGEIHGAKTQKELDVVEQKIVGVIMGRIQDLRAYYRIPDTIADNDIIEGLKTGNSPRYDKKGNFIGFGEVNSIFSERGPAGSRMSELNKNQLRLYSLSGFAYDAVYNTNCTGQAFSNTTFKTDKIVMSDGIKIMGQSRFQFNKKMSWRNGILRDDGIAARIKPVPRTQMGQF